MVTPSFGIYGKSVLGTDIFCRDKFIELTNRNQEKCHRLVFTGHNGQIIIDFLNMHERKIWFNEQLSEARQVKTDYLHFPPYLICQTSVEICISRLHDN